MKNIAIFAMSLVSASVYAAPVSNDVLKTWWHSPATSAVQIVNNMSLREQIGQTLMLDFRAWGKNEKDEPLALTKLNKEIAEIIYNYRLGSVILFRENLLNTTQTVDLINALQAARSNLPLFVSVDQEGGYVTRLQEGTEMPGNMALGATRNPALAELSGMVHGAELASLGFNFNFGPVVDVNSNQNNPVIGVRSYSDRPELVTTMANSYVKGIHKYNILTSAKHFPGHGNVAVDSHFGLPSVPYSVQEWRRIDLPPFAQALKYGADSVMTAHVSVPQLDNSQLTTLKGEKMTTPATLSKKIIDGVLRQQLKFDGLVLTDAMDMGAISSNFDMNWAVETALKAGVDIALMPIPIWDAAAVGKLDKLYTHLISQADKDEDLRERIKQSAQRVVLAKLTHRIDGMAKDSAVAKTIVASLQHKKLEDMVSENAITLIKNDAVLPFVLKENSNILVISDEQSRNDLIIKHINGLVNETALSAINLDSAKVALMGNDLSTDTLQAKIAQSDLIVLATYNLGKDPLNAQKIIDAANMAQKKLVVIATRNPYDIAHLRNVNANLAIYGVTGFDITNNNRNSLEANIKAGVKTLFADPVTQQPFNRPLGKLPVNIKSADGSKVLYAIDHGLTF
ncbi:MAG: glycoside hydrolase family 3 protein [Aeromonas sp.]